MSISVNIYFDPSFDGRAWTGKLTAEAGTHHVGPLGLLGLLETSLGLSAKWPTLPERTASMVGKLAAFSENERGFWKESFEADRLGAARELLRWSDHLKMAGWNGQGKSGRLAELARVTVDTPPGMPERLTAVLESLETSTAEKPEIDKLFVVEPKHGLPLLWSNILKSLADRGVEVTTWSPANASPAGNLLALRESTFFPRSDDDSLVLLQPQTIWEAAEHVAGWLANEDNSGLGAQTIIIGASPALDVALSRYGLPTSGAESKGPAAVAMANLLILIVAVAEDIPDPEQVFEFLFLPQQPLPRPVARNLINALHEFPGIGHSQWRENLDKAVAYVAEESPDKADRIRSLMDQLFPRDIPDIACGISKEDLQQRFEGVLTPWLKQKIALQNDSAPSAAAVLAQSELLVQLIGKMFQDTEKISLAQLRKLTTQVAEQSRNELHTAEASLHFVDAPEAIQAPADRVVWWNFTGDTVPPLEVLPLSQDELGVLSQNDCNIHNYFENCSAARAERWWRPLRSCAKQAVLVAPEQTLTGEQAARHPLWDETVAKIPEEGELSHIIRTDGIAPGLRTRKVTVDHRNARREWKLPNLVGARENSESPSGIETMLQCPFQWAMKYHAGLSEPLARKLPGGGLLDGKLFHEIFRRLCEDLPIDGDPGAKADEMFADIGPKLAASLFRRGAEGERERFRKKLIDCTNEIFRMSGADGSRIAGSEKELCGTIAGQKFLGRLDLLLQNPLQIIDIKNSKSDREKVINNGAAVQLIAYAHLLKESTGCDAEVAYFILNSRQLISDENRINGIEGWEALEATYTDFLEQVQKVLTAAGIPDGENEVVKNNKREDGRIELAPECKYCRYEVICGRNELEKEK